MTKNLRTDFLTDEEVHRQVHAMTPALFQKILAGQVRTRPKVIIDPQSGDVYRLRREDGASQYEKIEVAPTEILFFELTQEYLEKFRKKSPIELPPGFEMRRYTLQKDVKEVRPGEISRKQLYALMTAVGLDSRWWPIDDPYYDSHYYFKDLTINVMFREGKPIGVTMWRSPDAQHPKETYTSFMGVLEHERSFATSGLLFKWTVKQLADMGLERVVSTTSIHDGLLNLKDSVKPGEMVRKGIRIIDIVPCGPFDLVGKARLPHPEHFISHSDINMSPAYYRNGTLEPLPRFRYQEVVRRLNQAFGVNEAELMTASPRG